MRMYEHEAKGLFSEMGIPIPRSFGVFGSKDLGGPPAPNKGPSASRTKASAGGTRRGSSPVKDQACVSSRFRYPAMVKAQVLVGGRGKLGGVRRVDSQEETLDAAKEILALSIKGCRVENVLIESACETQGACYLAVAVNPYTANLVVMASASGGVDIEEIARERPDAILRIELPDNPEVLPDGIARKVGEFLAQGLSLGKDRARPFSDVVSRLYGLYQKYDCSLAEINPLLVTADGVVAADGKIILDDNALYRQKGLLDTLGISSKRHDVSEPTVRETRASTAGFTYVDLLPEGASKDPNKIYVGLVPGGAGYGIFSIDEVNNVGERYFDGRIVAVNFMDSGGGPSVQAVSEMFSLLMDYPIVDLIITSRFGGISSCDVFIRGVVQCLRERASTGERIVPIYGRMVGTELARGRAFLDKARQETPEALSKLSMVVGNRQIMAQVIQEALAEFSKGVDR